MGNLIIKSASGGTTKLQEDDGSDALTIDTSGGATISKKLKITGQSSDPITPSGNAGTIWFDSDINKLKVSDGTVYEIINAQVAFGGIINQYTTSGNTVRSHTFLSSGVFILPDAKTVDVFMIGGGGAGSSQYWSGGGAAGGVITQTSVSLSANEYQVIVGAGGPRNMPSVVAGATPVSFPGKSGYPSTFHTYTAIGGGGGDAFGDGGSNVTASTTDQWGNAIANGGGGVGKLGGSGNTGSAYDGGDGSGDHGNDSTGGGGAGAGGDGEAGTYTDPPGTGDGGAGGIGVTNFYRDGNTSGYVAGTHLFGGGGGGSSWSGGAGKEGGTVTNGGQTVTLGGAGSNSNGQAGDGIQNTGSGGGASGGAGGSGIVVIRYTI